MRKTMNKADVLAVVAEMKTAGTKRSAMMAMARAALIHSDLTKGGREAWLDLLAS